MSDDEIPVDTLLFALTSEEEKSQFHRNICVKWKKKACFEGCKVRCKNLPECMVYFMKQKIDWDY
jgi:hypothetical protein